MSVELMVEVLKHAPDTLNPTERLLLVVLAESCNKDTRLTWYRDGWDETEVCRRVGIAQRSLSRILTSLAKKGVEVRVPHAHKPDGTPLYAFRGRQITFRLPRLASVESYAPSRTNPEVDAEKGTQTRADSYADPRTNDPESYAGMRTLPLIALPSKNPSSLSDVDHEPAAVTIPVQRAERETEGVSQEPDQPLTPVQKLIGKHGAKTQDQIEFVEGWIDSTQNVQTPGFYFTADRNGSLAQLVADALNAEASSAARTTPCLRCDGYQQEWSGHYFTTTECLACYGSGARTDSGDRRCPAHPHYPVACSLCRADRLTSDSYIEQANHQQRSSARTAEFTPSTSASRARQALSVADELDRQNGHGKYAPGQNKPWRNPPNDDAYTDWSVLGGPKNRVQPGSVVSKSGSVRMTNSHHPDRDYDQDF